MLSKEEIQRDVYEVFSALGIVLEENQKNNIEDEMDKYGIVFSDDEILLQNYEGIESFVDLVSDKILALNN